MEDKELKKSSKNIDANNSSNNIEENIERVIIKKEGFNLLEVIIIMFITLVFGVLLGTTITFAKHEINTSNDEKTEKVIEIVEKDKDIPSEFDDFISTYNELKNNYYEEVNENDLLNAGIKGMVDFLGDKFSIFMDKEQTISFDQEVDGSYEGIGIEISLDYIDEKDLSKFDILVSNSYINGPAYQAGIRNNDQIIKVNGEDIRDKSIPDVQKLIQGKKGTTVRITILRNEKEYDYLVVRDVINIESVEAKTYVKNNKNIGYLKINLFAANTYEQFKNELLKLESKNIESLIIDVRDNSGGYLTTVTDIVSLFLDNSKIIYQLETKGNIEKIYSKTKEKRDYEIAVLINNKSASASEILTSALLESNNSMVIGVNSYGKGTVQRVNQLKSGATIKYTVQKWLTPNGNWIHEKGITPTVVVEETEEYKKTRSEEYDTQLDKALDLLSK